MPSTFIFEDLHSVNATITKTFIASLSTSDKTLNKANKSQQNNIQTLEKRNPILLVNYLTMDDTPIADPTVNEGEATEIAIAPAGTTEDEAANKDEASSGDLKEEDPTTIVEIMEGAEAATAAAGSNFGKENAEESAAVPAPVVKDNKDAPVAVVKEEISEAKEGIPEDQAGGEPMAVDKVEPSDDTTTPAKETKKRVRRVGRTPTRKIPKLEEKIATPLAGIGDNNSNADSAQVAVAAAVVDAAAAAIGAVSETAGAVSMESTVAQPPANQGVVSKHDEKWHAMFQKLIEFKERKKNTLVPQCYTEDPR